MSSGRSTSGGARLHLWIKVVLTLLLVLIGGLRFARMDLLGTSSFAEDRYYTFESDGGRTVENLNIDISQYLSMVEDFRGVERAFYKQEPYPEFADEPTATKGPVAPFINRPALPYLASLLPFDSPESFATVNLLLVVLGLWALFDSLRVKGYSAKAQFLGGLLYVIALPVVVFASSLYVDGGTVGLLLIGYWLIVRRWWPAVVVFLPLSYTAKEVLILLAPVAAMEWRASGRSFRRPAFVIGAIVTVVGWWAVGRAVQAAAPEPVLLYTVAPKLSTFLFNLGSVKSTLFFAIGMAPVVVPALLEIWRMQRGSGWRSLLDGPASPDVVGFATVVLLNLYSIVSTDLTLRTGWLIWPFAISLTCRWVDAANVGDRFGPMAWLSPGPAISGSASPSH